MKQSARFRWKQLLTMPGQSRLPDVSGLPDRDRLELGLPPKICVASIYDLKV